MAINFPNSPSNGDTHTAGGKTFTYDSTVGAWSPAPAGATTFIGLTDTPSSFGTASQIPAINSGANALEFIALPSSVTVYATVDLLPLSGNSAGDQALVTATNRLYIWNGSGWYNIALINTNPSISGASSSYALATDGTATTVTITATDPEGLPITYSIASDTSGNIATVAQGTGANTNVFTVTPSTNSANAGIFSLTFRASDGVNIATAVSEFTLQFRVENQRYTTALITSVGGNNAVNNSFVDSSTNSHTITAVGNAHQTTFSPYRHGGYSTYFDGSGDGISAPNHTSFDIGSGDFTIETWFYSSNPDNGYIFGKGDATTASGTSFWMSGGAGSGLYLFHGGSYTIMQTGALPVNQWTHLAFVRNGTNLSTYINGTSVHSITASITVNTTSNELDIGYYPATAWIGNLKDFRFVKGTAVYTSNFTPPDERLSAITNTSLLACHLPYIADGSTNSHAITVTGNTKTTPFAPYDTQGYSAASHGGSMYFDGTGDYLSIADHADLDMGSSDFTIEGWYYPVVTPGGSNGLLSKRANSSEANGILIYFGGTSTGEPSLLVAQSGSWSINTASSITFKTGQWNHFAIVRNGTSFKLYINGKAGVSVTSSITVTDNGHAFVIGAMGADGSNSLAESNISDFRVVKGTAIYTAEFTPPTAPLTAITNTSLLLNGTNAGIIDKSQSVKTITLNGDVKSSTTQSKYLSSSMYFDGNDYILMPDIELDSADYTVECWAWISAQGGTAGIFSKGSPGGLSGITWSLEFSSSNNFVALYIYNANSGAYIITGSTNIITSSWNHIAVTRSGNETKLFINGTQDGSTYTGNYTVASGGDFYLGGGFYAPTTRTITGYMSDFRVTKGLARYTSNFTPPTAALQG